MALTAAQYKAKFETAQTNSYNNTQFAAQKGVCWAQIASVWAFLYIEQLHIDAAGATISPQATSYRNNAETSLAAAESAAASAVAQSMSNSQRASVWAYAYVGQVKVDNPEPVA